MGRRFFRGGGVRAAQHSNSSKLIKGQLIKLVGVARYSGGGVMLNLGVAKPGYSAMSNSHRFSWHGLCLRELPPHVMSWRLLSSTYLSQVFLLPVAINRNGKDNSCGSKEDQNRPIGCLDDVSVVICHAVIRDAVFCAELFE